MKKKKEYFFEVSMIRTIHVSVENAISIEEAMNEIKRRMDEAHDSGIWNKDTIDMTYADVNDQMFDMTDEYKYNDEHDPKECVCIEQNINMDE